MSRRRGSDKLSFQPPLPDSLMKPRRRWGRQIAPWPGGRLHRSGIGGAFASAPSAATETCPTGGGPTKSRRGCPNQGSYSLTPAKMLTVFSLVARREARVPRAGAPAPGRPFVFSLAPGGRTSSINHVKWEMCDWSFDGWLSTPQLCSSRRLRDQLRP
jgi:hypothetical protein